MQFSSTGSRVLGKELLDDLPPQSREAMQSRRDLVWVNAWMGNAKLAAREMENSPKTGRRLRIADIGGGDGRFIASVASQMASRLAVDALVVDRHFCMDQAAVSRCQRHGWSLAQKRADVFAWADSAGRYDAILANLFLHHFTSVELKGLFSRLMGKTSMVVAVEPRRNGFSLALTHLLWVIGCNHVTRHDAKLSVRAGFKGQELSAIWPEEGEWRLREYRGGFSSHVFVAVRE